MSQPSTNRISTHSCVMLSLLGETLFGMTANLPVEVDWDSVCAESFAQAVLPLVLSVARNHGIPSSVVKTWEDKETQLLAKNLRSDYDHAGLHRALKRNGVNYVAIKGCVSASYYPNPSLRMMGDIDIFVKENEMPSVDKTLKKLEFKQTDSNDFRHVSYQRRDTEIEVHRGINGVPSGNIGKIVQKRLDGIVERAVPLKLLNGECMVLCPEDHGLVMLLHTALHMTNSGVGLRQICDFLVFANKYQSSEFESLIKEIGLWKFASTLVKLGEQYMNMPHLSNYDEVDSRLVESLVCDIIESGNFGKKDKDRYRQIKYITTLDKVKVDKNNFSQLLSSMNQKVWLSCDYVRKNKILYPVGWLQVGGHYIKQLANGKRSLKTETKTMDNANRRKAIYKDLQLFENDKNER